VNYEELVNEIVKPEFTSLQDIREAAARRSIALRIAKLEASDLGSIPTPFIAHWEAVEISGHESGHYVVVTHIGAVHIEYLDGTAATTSKIGVNDFYRRWSGAVAYVPNSRVLVVVRYCSIAALLVLLLLKPLSSFIAILVRSNHAV
jgi:ABC-type bacteriocin/lantibiotic exporter with double-glycine peptidase domain